MTRLFLIFSMFFLVLNNANAEKYYEVVNSGRSFGWVNDHIHRFDKAEKFEWTLDDNAKTAFKNYGSSYIRTQNLDIGRRVGILTTEFGDSYLLDVSGDLVLVASDGLMHVNKEKFLKFQEKERLKFVKGTPTEGYILGQTQPDDLGLNAHGMPYTPNIVDLEGRLIDYVIDLEDIPCVDDFCPIEKQVHFLDGVAYDITLVFKPKKKENNYFHMTLTEVLELKYERKSELEDFYMNGNNAEFESDYDTNVIHINKDFGAIVTRFHQKSPKYVVFYRMVLLDRFRESERIRINERNRVLLDRLVKEIKEKN